MNRRDEVEEREYSTGVEFVEDYVDSRNGVLAKDIAFVQLLVADRGGCHPSSSG